MAKKKPATDPAHIKDLTPAAGEFQPRVHTARNIGLIADALQEVGAARSIVIDEAGTVLAGNGVVEAAAQAGIYKVKVVEGEGDEIVAVRRRGLTDDQKKRLALFDNRAGEIALYDRDVVGALQARGLTTGIFTDEEVAALIAAAAREEPEAPEAFAAPDEATDFRCPQCGYAWSGKPK
jgi:rubrerythrin